MDNEGGDTEAVADVALPALNEELDDAEAWHSIDWGRAERDVRRMRRRIFKAAQDGDLKEVRGRVQEVV